MTPNLFRIIPTAEYKAQGTLRCVNATQKCVNAISKIPEVRKRRLRAFTLHYSPGCIQVALSAILTVVDVDSSTLYGLSHLGKWQCFLLRLLIRTQSPDPTLVSASQVPV